MDRDTIIRLAKQCGHWSGETIEMNDVGIERFAALIEDHLTYSSIHTCNPDCTKPACVSMRKAEAHAAAVEREECARVAETLALDDLGSTDDWPDAIAAAIRGRT